MNKNEFLSRLEALLQGMENKERIKALSFYSEMIDDFIEEGNSEEEAIARVGKPGEVAEQIIIEESSKLSKEQSKSKKALVGVLLVLGCPLWLTFLLMAFCIIMTIVLMTMALYLIIWLIPFVFGAVTVASLLISVVSTLGSFALMVENIALGVTQLGFGVFAAGLFLVLFILTVLIGKYFVEVSKHFKNLIDKHIIQKVRGIKLWAN